MTTDASPAQTSADSRPAREPRLLSVEVDGQTVVYDEAANVVHRLDRAATAVWRRLDGLTSLRVIAEDVAREHGADLTRVRRDVLDVISVLWNSGLLVGAPRGVIKNSRLNRPYVPEVTDLVPDDLPATPYVSRGVRALLHSFRVATNDLEVHGYLRGVFAALPETPVAPAHYQLFDLGAQRSEGQPRYVLRFHDEPLVATSWLPRVLAVLLWHVNQEAVRASSPHYVLLHAAAAARDGVGVLLPAPTESGKTTTVAGLVRAGFGYLSDEIAAIDPQSLTTQPFPKALSIDRGSWDVLAALLPPDGDLVAGQWQVPPDSIRAGAVADPTSPRLLVAPSYGHGEPTALHHLSRAEMLVLLADSTFAFSHAPTRNLDVLARLVSSCDCFRLVIGDLAAAVALITEQVNRIGSEELNVAESEPPVP